MERFRLALFDWQMSSEDQNIAQRVNTLVKEAARSRSGITIRIKEEILKRRESSNAISPADLQKYFRREGHDLVCDLVPAKGPKGQFFVGVLDLWPAKNVYRGIIDKYNFVIAKREENSWRLIGIFRPHEIESITPKVKV